MEAPSEQLRKEELRHNELSLNRSRNQESQAIKASVAELRKIKPPSRFAYFFYFSASVIADALDIVEALFLLFTGTSSGIVSVPIAIIISFVFIVIGYFENGKLKRREKASVALAEKVQHIDQRIQQYRKMYAGALKLGRKIKPLRKPIAQFALRMRKFTSKNKILTKVVGYSLLQIIPILDLWPWQTMATWQTYKARKLAYKEAQEQIAISLESQREEQEEFRRLQEAAMEESLSQ